MSFVEPFIGIDFGTTQCSMAWYNIDRKHSEILKNREGLDTTPSVVYFGDNSVLVGKYAEEMLKDPQEKDKVINSIKRNLVKAGKISVGRRRIPRIEIATEIFKKLKSDAEELHFYKPVNKAVITYPAHFDDLQRDKIEEAGIAAGFEEIEMLQEPVAAAIAYQQEGLNVGQGILVYDLGGGTFDVAILTKDEENFFKLAMPPEGLSSAGGDDFDEELYFHLDGVATESLNNSIIDSKNDLDLNLLYECRSIKERLSNSESVNINLPAVDKDGNIQRFKHTITRSEFENLVDERIRSTIVKTHKILTSAKDAQKPVDTVVLIGGSSRIPLISQELEKMLPITPTKWQKQDVAVALGAAVYGNRVWGLTNEERSELEKAKVYKEFKDALSERNWQKVEVISQKMTDLDPDYRDVPQLLKDVEKEKDKEIELTSLYPQLVTAIENQDWERAMNLGRRIKAIDPDYEDTPSLLAQAEEAFKDFQLIKLSEDLKKAIENRAWSKALSMGNQIRAIDINYPGIDGMLEEAQEKQKAQEKVATLYSNMEKAASMELWEKVVEIGNQIESIEPGYTDVQLKIEHAQNKLNELAIAKKKENKLGCGKITLITLAVIVGLSLLCAFMVFGGLLEWLF